jgi:anti-anti-sigma factor
MFETLEGVVVEAPEEAVAVVRFTGEHDLTTSASVSELLDGLLREKALVVADFSNAQFVDSSTLRVLIGAYRSACERGTTFRLQLGTEAIVKRAFEISGILEQIGWASSREEALNRYTKPLD